MKTYLVTQKTMNTCIWTLSVNEYYISSGTSHLGVELSGPSANTETLLWGKPVEYSLKRK